MSIENNDTQPDTPEIINPVDLLHFLSGNVIDQLGDRRMDGALTVHEAFWKDPNSDRRFLLKSEAFAARGKLSTTYYLHTYPKKSSPADASYQYNSRQADLSAQSFDEDGHPLADGKHADHLRTVIEYLALAPSSLESEDRQKFREFVADVAVDGMAEVGKAEGVSTRKFADFAFFAARIQDALQQEPMLTEEEIREAVKRRLRQNSP